MARHEQVKPENELNDQKRLRNRPEQPPELRMAADEGITSILGQAVNPSLDQHAQSLAGAGSEMQRVDLTRQLQRNYGNRYVQRVIERSRDSLRPQQTTSVSLKSNAKHTAIAVNFKTLVKNVKSEEEGSQESHKAATELPGSNDSIAPAYLGLAQQTSVGGSALAGTAHGSYTPEISKSVVVEKHEGVISTDWEVRASLVINYRYSIQSLGKDDVLSAYSESVQPDTWRDIVTDLRPMGGGIPRSPRFMYWCSDLTASHEMYHIMDCMSAFKNFLPEQEKWLSEQSATGKVGAERLGYQALDQLVARVLSYMGSGNDAAQETRAYGAGAGQYEARAQSVEDRAYTEGWMDEADEDWYEEDHEEEEEEYEYDEEEVEEEDESESWWDDLWDDLWEDEEELEDEEEVEKEEKNIDNEGYGYGEEPYGEEEQEYLYGGETPEEEEYGYGYGYGYGEEEDYGYGYGYGGEEEYYEEEDYGGGEEYGGYEESYEEEDYGGGWGYGDEYSEEDYY